ncbi:hypothetical protein MKEN_01151800 [Mycena kentingensis (nom. inval.)]|nr:hypothetical protein MKEN_01151800 [Mycena kentingensis (nom. inval.)]
MCPRDTGRSNGTGNPPTDATSTAVQAFLCSLRPLQPLPGMNAVDTAPPAIYVEALTGVKPSSTPLGPSRRSLGQQRRWERERGMREDKAKENRPRNIHVDSKRGAGQRARRQRELATEIRSLQRVPVATRTAADSQTIRRRVERAHKMLDADRHCDPDATLETQLATLIYESGPLAKYGPYIPIDDSIPEGDALAGGTWIGSELANSRPTDVNFASGSDDATSAVDDTMVGTSTENTSLQDT